MDDTAFYQVSTLNSLMLGNFDGVVSVEELLRHASWGVGTFEGLDGEAVLCDGHVYDGRADGSCTEQDPSALLPFCAAADFTGEAERFSIHDCCSLAAVEEALDAARDDGNDNLWHLVALHSLFPQVRWRSCPKQEKPYPTMEACAREQREFEAHAQAGWVIGVRVPPYMAGVNMPGWHLHFLSEDRRRGGHLLDLAVQVAAGRLQSYHEFQLVVPVSPEFGSEDLTQDLSTETRRVEGQ